MPTYRAKKSSVPFHSNYWENCHYDKCHETYYRFNKEQYYEGEFFRDGIHGQGTYTWNEVAVYEGSFYSNSKEGYASLSLPDNSNFEGLFIRNEPFGPGILTHANGRQDAGFWVGRKLVRLSRAVDFIIPRLAPTSAAKLKLLQFRRLIPLNETDWDVSTDVLKKCGYPFEHFYSPYSSLIYDPRSIFFDTPAFEKTYFVNIKEVLKEFSESQKSWESLTKARENGEEIKVHSSGPCLQNSFSIDYENQDTPDICDRESSEGEYEMGILGYFTKFGTIEGLQKNEEGEEEEDKEEFDSDENFSATGEAGEIGKSTSRPPNIVSWNRSELCTEMLKQIFRYRAFEEKLTFDLAQLMLGVRTAFRRTGLRERQCLQFLKMCSLGPAHVVRDLLCSHEISEELMDARGNNSLMFAAAADQHEIMDVLLDYGVDVNTFNDENLTPLNLCLLRRLAYSRGISSWETAFLPKEIDVPREYQEPQVLETQVSISSLDRIFGDGMSLSDSKSRIFDSRYLTPFPSPTNRESSEINQLQFHRSLDDSRDMSDLSQITILNINKSPGSHVLVYSGMDDEPRMHFGEKRSSSTSGAREMKEASQPLGSNEETPRINIHMVPKSNKRDEFLRSILKSKKDRYLFEFTFEKKPPVLVVESKKIETLLGRNKRGNKQLKADSVEEEEEEQEEDKAVDELVDFELTKKMVEIDKTIQKLLRRGADPNISEVPKPAIHLGIYTKDLNTVYNLLLYGANPNSQLYANEGLLTPLHVVVLQPSSREQVDICELLLNFMADPDKETHPEFSICEHEKGFLDPQQGRTPLQLLCMRPDLEYADPDENLIKIGLLLAEASKKKCFYNGHTYLTLAMLFGNMKLFKALLKSNLFDPNEVLEKDRGTALHVLVSTELQKKTSFDNSISMCDRLIEAGANPLKKFQHPKSLQGTCVDYGYREIETEKELRRGSMSLKKDAKKTEKSGKERILSRDYLQDHEKVVEYLSDIALGMAGKKKTGSRKRKPGDSSQDSLSEDLRKEQGALGKSGAGTGGEDGKEKEDSEGDKGKKKQKGKGLEESKNGKDGKKGEKEPGKGKKGDSETQKSKKGRGDGEEGTGDEEDSERGKKRKAPLGEGKTEETDVGKVKKRKGEDEEEGGKRGKKNKMGLEAGKEGRKDGRKEKEAGQAGKKEKEAGRDGRKGTKAGEKDSKKDQYKLKDKDSNLLKQSKCSIKHSSTRQLGARSETFPEQLRQNLLQMYGNCFCIDINEFLVPYVVLRDGDLYYRFNGKTQGHKEQYSLI